MEWFTDQLRNHYGFDWAAMVFTFLSLYRLSEHKRDGFVWGLAAGLAWTAFNITVPSVAGILANVVFIYMNGRGYLKWRKDARDAPVSGAAASTQEGGDV
ncbi:MAG: YgjV family protein [Planctomycetota bacterium]